MCKNRGITPSGQEAKVSTQCRCIASSCRLTQPAGVIFPWYAADNSANLTAMVVTPTEAPLSRVTKASAAASSDSEIGRKAIDSNEVNEADTAANR